MFVYPHNQTGKHGRKAQNQINCRRNEEPARIPVGKQRQERNQNQRGRCVFERAQYNMPPGVLRVRALRDFH